MLGSAVIKVGLTAKEVGRLAKRHPDVIEKDAGGHARRIVDIFLQDLQVGKVIPLVRYPRPPPPSRPSPLHGTLHGMQQPFSVSHPQQ